MYRLRERTYSVGFLDTVILNTILVGLFDIEVEVRTVLRNGGNYTTRRNIPEDLDLQQRRCENLKRRMNAVRTVFS